MNQHDFLVVERARRSLRLGLLSFFFWVFTAVPAVLAGVSVLRAIRHTRGQLRGRWRARAGILAGLAGSVTCPVLVLAFVSNVREASDRIATGNNLKNISLALHDYHDTYGVFPPPFHSARSGGPPHSWRLLIDPYIE